MDNQPARLFLIWSKSRGCYTSFRSLLEKDDWTVLIIQDLSNLSTFSSTNAKNIVCLAILNPDGSLSGDDIVNVHEFIWKGYSVILALSATSEEDGLISRSVSINELSSAYGVKFNDDQVIRPNLYKFYHPQEAMIEDFVANRGLDVILRKHISQKPSDDSLLNASDGPIKFGPKIIYPNGCTMQVDIKSSTIMMTTSKGAIPSGQPIGAFHRNERSQARVVMLGSASLMDDNYIDKEDNRPLVSCIMEFLTDENFPINISDARTIEIAENNLTADMKKLVENPIGCLRELEHLPENKSDLIDTKLFSIDNSQLPNVLKAYKDLGIAYEGLRLMKPTFHWKLDQGDGTRIKFLLKHTDQQ
jgi:intraflagellar transport protein 52